MTLNPGDTVREVAQFRCPFCGGQCAVVEPPGVLHVEPVCQRFLDGDPVSILAAANEAKRREN